MRKIIGISLVVVLAIVLSGCTGGGPLGGSTSDDFNANSFEVDGTTVIDSNRGGSFGDLTKVDYATSTVQIGDTTNGIGEGCLVLGDSGGATSSPVYITASGATVTATTTQPSICE